MGLRILAALALSACSAAAPNPSTPAAEKGGDRTASRTAEAPPRPLNEHERQLSQSLKRHVEQLSKSIGERNAARVWELASAADYLATELEDAGLSVDRQGYEVNGGSTLAINLGVEVRGAERGEEIIVVGAHYDSAPGTPGADDNASGTAAVLELARALRASKPDRTLRFVLFTNGEAPFLHTQEMGSSVYAKRLVERGEKVVAMLSVDSIGYYSTAPSSQSSSADLAKQFPPRGDFLAVVGDTRSERLVAQIVSSLIQYGSMPVQGTSGPAEAQAVSSSDQWAFWQMGFPAVMVTDTARLRSPHHHKQTDTVDKLDFERMARVVAALEGAIVELSGSSKGTP